MGRALEYNYFVRLGTAAGDDYKIIETNCAPAPGDTGHKQQCEFLKGRRRAHAEHIATEQATAGRDH